MAAMLLGFTAQAQLQRHSTIPEITLPQPDGTPLSISSLKGKYVLIDFWAHWCVPCRVEAKNIKKVYEQYKDKGFTVFSVSVDKPRDKQKWIEAITKDGASWAQVLDEKGEVSDKYGVESIPALFLIDPEGNLISQGDGLRGKGLAKTLDKYLK